MQDGGLAMQRQMVPSYQSVDEVKQVVEQARKIVSQKTSGHFNEDDYMDGMPSSKKAEPKAWALPRLQYFCLKCESSPPPFKTFTHHTHHITCSAFQSDASLPVSRLSQFQLSCGDTCNLKGQLLAWSAVSDCGTSMMSVLLCTHDLWCYEMFLIKVCEHIFTLSVRIEL